MQNQGKTVLSTGAEASGVASRDSPAHQVTRIFAVRDLANRKPKTRVSSMDSHKVSNMVVERMQSDLLLKCEDDQSRWKRQTIMYPMRNISMDRGGRAWLNVSCQC